LKSGIDFKGDFENIVDLLIYHKEIPVKYKDHQLANCKDFKDCKELHIKPDLLLVYRLSEASVELLQLGVTFGFV
jgi:mRNA interferase YafQ